MNSSNDTKTNNKGGRFVLGLTGGIGTGKSTAAAFIKEKGFIHIDADAIGWEITAEGSPLLPELDRLFGPEGPYGVMGTSILDEEGRLLRKNMASVVFADKNKIKVFNEIMFSRIKDIIKERINSSEKNAKILLDAPLLFEAGVDVLCDVIMLITADFNVRIERVCSRDNATVEQVRERIRNQMSDEEKIRRADIVVDNSGSVDQLYENLDEKISELLLTK